MNRLLKMPWPLIGTLTYRVTVVILLAAIAWYLACLDYCVSDLWYHLVLRRSYGV